MFAQYSRKERNYQVSNSRGKVFCGMPKRQTTSNYRKPPQKTQNHHTSPHTTTNHHQNVGIGSETRDDAGKPPQTNTRIWDDGYSCAGKKQLFCLSYGSFKTCGQAVLVEHDAFANTDHSKSCIFTMFQWWFVVILRRLAL